ncbi:MAG: YdeI/OmpD-associated family protein [Fluviicola sp.]|nr:YdeI/OmpD-associated family protein [Fluviicola sp.]
MEQSIVTYTTPVVKLHYLNYVVIEVPPVILDRLPGKFEKGNYNQRLIIRLDNAIEWQCGLLAMGEGSACVTIQSKRLKELKKVIGDDVEVRFFKDESTYGVEVAEEIAEYWSQDAEAFRRFSQLTPSMQRYILNYITTVKNPDKRLERTLLLMRNLLRSTEGKESFRELLGK